LSLSAIMSGSPKNKAAGRSIIARRLRHAWSGGGQYPVPNTLVVLLSVATKVAR
jgi:hypothetical protein